MLIDVIEKTLPFHLPVCQSIAAVDIFILFFRNYGLWATQQRLTL